MPLGISLVGNMRVYSANNGVFNGIVAVHRSGLRWCGLGHFP